ncbi:MAG: DUF6464 family protein [Cyanobacteria bacterium J06623_5]
MKPKSLLTDIVLENSKILVAQQVLDRTLPPGTYIDVDGQSYQILIRRHQYQLKLGRYHLHKAIVLVKASAVPEERSLLNGSWVIGDISCLYNARSELIRCAPNPEGPCQGCNHYQCLEEQCLEE